MKRRPPAQGLYDPRNERDACGLGFVAQITGAASRAMIDKAHEVLLNLSHRGAVGSDAATGDGAGIMTALPDRFYRRVLAEEQGVELPPRGRYGVGLAFFSPTARECAASLRRFEAIARAENQTVLAVRKPPRRNDMLGRAARACEPAMRQIFIAAAPGDEGDEFERALYVIRKRAAREIRGSAADPDGWIYICNLSSRVVVYKGMLKPDQLFAYFEDLRADDYESNMAMVHSRFSTNTFPSWDRAQPFRYIAHNGEINTLRGNINKMRAREGQIASDLFGARLGKLSPMIGEHVSDSGAFDAVFELLAQSGRALPEVVMMMAPEAWQNRADMDRAVRAAYDYMSCQMEPWDGPAIIAFTDGRLIGALSDRNGLRPGRFCITDDGVAVLASEAGVLDAPPEKVVQKGRLRPGQMFAVDLERGEVLTDADLKRATAGARPYARWLREQRLTLADLAPQRVASAKFAPPVNFGRRDDRRLMERLRLFDYTVEHLNLILHPMAATGKEPLGSMGSDTPLAFMSRRPRLLYDYFKQLFAQVTNPPIDSIREKAVMSLSSHIGPERNLLTSTPEHCRRLLIEHPLLSHSEFETLKSPDRSEFKALTVDCTYAVADGAAGLTRALERVSGAVEQAIADGYLIAILSDRAAGSERAPVPMLLALGATHHHLVRRAKRTQIALAVDSGEPREVHHFCVLLGFGADAIHPYLALEAIALLRNDGLLDGDLTLDELYQNYKAALSNGIRKVFGKMGIATLESYKAAQIFEIIGLAESVVDRCFAYTASRIGGVDFETLAAQTLERHRRAYAAGAADLNGDLDNPGDYQWRTGGEKHMWHPQALADLQIAVRSADEAAYKRFAAGQNGARTANCAIRDLLKFKPTEPIDLSEVEPAGDIMRRFATGAMSFGSISQEAHETLALAMNRVGGKSNTGEGGELPERYKPLPNGDSKRSRIKQIASGRFGVTMEYLNAADEIQIKMAQGAKPGEGGELPGHKVFDIIARTRHSTPGVGLISPPPHHDIYSIEDLAQLIFDLKNANPRARVSVKLVSEVGVGAVAAGVAKARADHILISGHDGGTGASPLTGVKHAGAPWELGLAETQQTLTLNDLRSRVVLQTDGQLKTGRDVIIAALLGAEEFGFSTAPLIAMGCVMMRVCHKNTCPVGIATQDERLRRKFSGAPEHVITYFKYVAEDARRLMAKLGFAKLNDLIGRVDLLEVDERRLGAAPRGVDLRRALHKPTNLNPSRKPFQHIAQNHEIENVLDRRLIAALPGAGRSVEMAISNKDRAVGAMLSNHLTNLNGSSKTLTTPFRVKFRGAAGQSFGAWLVKGVVFELEGEANDYVGKGLSGGALIVYPPRRAKFVAERNMLIGNVAFYGAVGGEAYLRGLAGERFCVRNSGASVVVEGVGDHCCEYMTGGRALILGETGVNFGAGMSGGIAYVWDARRQLSRNLADDIVNIEPLTAADEATVFEMTTRHRQYTDSAVAKRVLERWESVRGEFVRVIAPEYKKMLNE